MMPDGVDEEHTTTPPPSRLLFQVRSRVLLDVAEQQQPLLWMGEVVDRRSSSSNNNFVTNCEDVRDPKDCLRDPHILFDPLTKIPMEYTCRSDLEERSTLTELEGLEEVEVEDDDDLRVAVAETWVQVDYEALLPIQADAKYNERQLQWRVLLAAVEEVGLDRCDFTKQRGRPLDDDVDDIDTDTDTDTTTSTTSTTPPRLRRGRRQRRRQRHLEEFSTATTAGLPANLTIYAIENDLASSFAFPIREFCTDCDCSIILYIIQR